MTMSKNNQGWISEALLVALLVIGLATTAGLAGYWAWGKLLLRFPAYSTAYTYLSRHPKIQETLGTIRQWDSSPSGYFDYNRQQGSGEMTLHLKGEKAAGSVTIKFYNEETQPWLIDKATLKVAGTSETINQPPSGGEGKAEVGEPLEGALLAPTIDLDAPEQWENKAYEALDQRNIDEASHFCDLIREAAPNDYRGYYCLAEAAWAKGDKVQFLEIRKNLADLNPSYYLYAKQLGNAYQEIGNHEKSIEHLLRAWELRPTADTASDIAASYLELGNNEKALDFLHKASDLAPDGQDASLFYRYGRYYLMTGDLEKATEYFDRAREADSDFANAYFGLAQSSHAANEKEKAIYYFEQGIDRAPTNSLKFRNQLIELLISLNYFDEAIYHLIKTTLYHPDDLPTYLKLAELYRKQGRNSAADYVMEYVKKLRAGKAAGSKEN